MYYICKQQNLVLVETLFTGLLINRVYGKEENTYHLCPDFFVFSLHQPVFNILRKLREAWVTIRTVQSLICNGVITYTKLHTSSTQLATAYFLRTEI